MTTYVSQGSAERDLREVSVWVQLLLQVLSEFNSEKIWKLVHCLPYFFETRGKSMLHVS